MKASRGLPDGGQVLIETAGAAIWRQAFAGFIACRRQPASADRTDARPQRRKASTGFIRRLRLRKTGSTVNRLRVGDSPARQDVRGTQHCQGHEALKRQPKCVECTRRSPWRRHRSHNQRAACGWLKSGASDLQQNTVRLGVRERFALPLFHVASIVRNRDRCLPPLRARLRFDGDTAHTTACRLVRCRNQDPGLWPSPWHAGLQVWHPIRRSFGRQIARLDGHRSRHLL